MPTSPEPAPQHGESASAPESAPVLSGPAPLPSATPPLRGVRFPLSAKILLWFFVNLVFLGATAWIFGRAQLRLGLDSLLAGPVNDRLQTMARVVSAQLADRPPAEWNEVLATNAAAYGVRLAIFRHDGRRLAGELNLPNEVMARLLEARPKLGPPDNPRGRSENAPRDGPRGDGDRALRDADRPPRSADRPLPNSDQALRSADRPLPNADQALRSADRPLPNADQALRSADRPLPNANRPLRDGDRPGNPERRPDRPPPRDFEPDGPRGGRDGEPPPPEASQGSFPKMMLHTQAPNLYWVLIRLPVIDRQFRPPQPTTLVLATESLRGGGLLFDFRPWLIGGAVVLALSVLLWLPLVIGITRVLRQMTGAAEAIAQGRFETAVPASRRDELGRLASALNHMSARLREFFTGQKRFLGDIAHELCSPLARMEMALGILDQRADEKQHAYVADVREELRHMSALVNELLSFSKAGVSGKNLELKPVGLAETIGRVIAREAKDRSGVVVAVPGLWRVLAEPELLARALGNVLRNALRYAAPASAEGEGYSYRPALDAHGRPAGPITISAQERGAQILVTITDSGPGVPEETLHRLFDPFFRPESARTRETGGAGLGLAIVKSCVEACGGTVAARNVQPSGLQVEFTLRRA